MSIIIQGQTLYCEQIIKNIFINENIQYIWSTWSDEPKNNLKKIFDSGLFKLLINKKPEFYGFHNLNLQTNSTIYGLKEAIHDKILKIRSDILIDNYEAFLNILNKKDNLTFLCWHYNSGNPYAIDYFSYGTKEENEKFWNFNGLSTEPPEIQLIKNYSKIYNMKPEDILTKKIDYVLNDLNIENINLFWLKRQINVKNYIIHDCYKF